MKNSSLFNQS